MQGYGRVDLSRTLPLAADGPWRMRMLDSVNISQGKEHRYCVRARGGPLRITLVWCVRPHLQSSKDPILPGLAG